MYGWYSTFCTAISIHALLAESDSVMLHLVMEEAIFQSTLSLRRATIDIPPDGAGQVDFNPRSPCGERRLDSCPTIRCAEISIHALLAESDSKYHQIGPIVSV